MEAVFTIVRSGRNGVGVGVGVAVEVGVAVGVRVGVGVCTSQVIVASTRSGSTMELLGSMK
jgi:hypothetical protein